MGWICLFGDENNEGMVDPFEIKIVLKEAKD